MAKITVLGCGFGTALSVMWDKNGHKITAWTKFQNEIDDILRDGEHKRLLPGVIVPPSIGFTTDISVAGDCDILVFAIPSAFVREAAEKAVPYVKEKTVIINVGKGFEESTKKRQSEVLIELFPNNPVVVLTGPCHAEEVGRDMPTSVVCASTKNSAAFYIQETLQNDRFRIYISDDVAGCELGGALKNPIALCCGIVEGMGLGDNTLAALMTRGLTEITRLAVALGANWTTFTGLSGLGDLIVTCTSTHSRNHRAGLLIGKGMPAADAIAKVGTVEGYACAKIALSIAMEHNVPVPIIEQLCEVCFEGKEPVKALHALMSRPQREEKEHYWNS